MILTLSAGKNYYYLLIFFFPRIYSLNIGYVLVFFNRFNHLVSCFLELDVCFVTKLQEHQFRTRLFQTQLTLWVFFWYECILRTESIYIYTYQARKRAHFISVRFGIDLLASVYDIPKYQYPSSRGRTLINIRKAESISQFTSPHFSLRARRRSGTVRFLLPFFHFVIRF